MPAGVAEGKGEMDVVNRPRVCLGNRTRVVWKRIWEEEMSVV